METVLSKASKEAIFEGIERSFAIVKLSDSERTIFTQANIDASIRLNREGFKDAIPITVDQPGEVKRHGTSYRYVRNSDPKFMIGLIMNIQYRDGVIYGEILPNKEGDLFFIFRKNYDIFFEYRWNGGNSYTITHAVVVPTGEKPRENDPGVLLSKKSTDEDQWDVDRWTTYWGRVEDVVKHV